jgi:serine protease
VMPEFAPDHVLVGFDAGTPRTVERSIEASIGAREHALVGADTHLLEVAPGHVLSAVEALKQDAGVRYAEPDWVLAADQTPNDPGLGNEWGLLNTGQTIVVNQDTTVAGMAGADIKAPAAWDVTTGAAWDPVTNPAAPVVGVVDSGIYYNHPDLAPNMWADPLPFDFKYTYTDSGGTLHTDTTCPEGSRGWDSIRHLCDPYDPARPPWHGSMVSGVIGAKGNDSTGIAGVNWSVRMMGLRWDQNWCLCGYTSQAIEAIEYAVQAKRIWDSGDSAAGIATHTQGANVRVLSNSYGCCYPVSTETGKLPYDPALLDEVRKAGDANILFVASGGNSSYDIDPPNYAHGHYPCSFDNANTFGSYDAGTGIFEPDTFEQSLGPAKNVICVASSNYADQRSSFSNWGQHTIQLAAPGTDIYSTNHLGSYSFGSGTSFSTPFVSGVAALLLSLHPDLDVVALKHALVGTYSQESTPYTGCPCGYQGGGAVDQLSAFDGLLSTGGGRLDACKAIPTCGADFALVPSPTSRSVTLGSGTSYTITTTPSGGFTGSVSLSQSGLPSGVTASFDPNPATSSSTLSVTTSGATATGSFPVTIAGTGGSLTHSATVTLVIAAPPLPAPLPPPSPPVSVSCHVPEVTGRPFTIARGRIKKAHCAVGSIRRAHSRQRRGLVIAQRPHAGRTLPRGARVNLVISRGRKR